ncbi:hypothetical protein [Planococcus sp. S3-L1]|uniref:hypothetical protein n=1 Tax=Planococcus sp. S3-L1 TaxID=3046200 RepID=UPI0024BA6623|nr:hypothetical protein [Planococcus sp. S3-L1]MDJ0331718.1 hypothetical protein [Planococcus sp. S3-L1]
MNKIDGIWKELDLRLPRGLTILNPKVYGRENKVFDINKVHYDEKYINYHKELMQVIEDDDFDDKYLDIYERYYLHDSPSPDLEVLGFIHCRIENNEKIRITMELGDKKHKTVISSVKDLENFINEMDKIIKESGVVTSK